MNKTTLSEIDAFYNKLNIDSTKTMNETFQPTKIKTTLDFKMPTAFEINEFRVSNSTIAIK